ncbi:MAG: ABC transporter substrate-binding protein [Pseudomonadota bacterium]
MHWWTVRCFDVSIEERPEDIMRIVTLTPGATDIVIALGLESSLVGVAEQCLLPARLSDLTRFTFPAPMLSDATQRLTAEIRALKPDVVVSDDCGQGERVDLALPNVRTIHLVTVTLDDLFENISRVGQALGATSAAELALRGLRYRRNRIAERASRIRDEQKPRVLFLEQLKPPLSASRWTPQLISLAGGRSLMGMARDNSGSSDWDRISVLDPDVIFVASDPTGRSTSVDQLAMLASRREWRKMRAVEHHRVYLTNEKAIFDAAGPALIDALEVLAHTLHPSLHEPPLIQDVVHKPQMQTQRQHAGDA